MWFGMAALPDQDTFVMTGGVGYANGNALGNPALMYNTTSSSWSAITSQPFEQTYVDFIHITISLKLILTNVNRQMNTLVADVQRKDRYFIYGGRRFGSPTYHYDSWLMAYLALIYKQRPWYRIHQCQRIWDIRYDTQIPFHEWPSSKIYYINNAFLPMLHINARNVSGRLPLNKS